MSVSSTSEGYITVALNTYSVDYLRMAYALALSVRRNAGARPRGLSVIVESASAVPDRYRWAFDEIIELDRPLTTPDQWRVADFFSVYSASPYSRTVALDADTIVLGGLDHWWIECGDCDLLPGRAVNYRGRPIWHNPLRESFYRAGLPDWHNCGLLFTKSRLAEEFFALGDAITRSWSTVTQQVFGRVEHYSADAACAIALSRLGLVPGLLAEFGRFFPFVHMKAGLQGWPDVPGDARDWRPHVEWEWRDGGVWFGPRRCALPFHYHVRDFVTDAVLEDLEG